MNDEIPVIRDDPQWTVEEYLAIQKQKHEHKNSIIVTVMLSLVTLSLFVPLGVWLTRLALGG